MQQSFETIFLDASAESWEQSGESARPDSSFGELLDLYANHQKQLDARAAPSGDWCGDSGNSFNGHSRK